MCSMPAAKTRLATVFTTRPVTSYTRSSTFSVLASPNDNRASPECIGFDVLSFMKFTYADPGPLPGLSPTPVGAELGWQFRPPNAFVSSSNMYFWTPEFQNISAPPGPQPLHVVPNPPPNRPMVQPLMSVRERCVADSGA